MSMNNPETYPPTWSGAPAGCGMPNCPLSCPYANNGCGEEGNSNVTIIQYTIQPGDNLWSLAAQYNSSVDAIMAANPGMNPNNLQVGQMILIPDPPFGGWGDDHWRDDHWRGPWRGGPWRGGPWFRPWFGPWFNPWGPWI